MVQRQHKDGKRPRISVSLDPEDYDWIQSLGGPSDSYSVSRVVKAARLAGLKLEDSHEGGVLQEFCDWLATKKRSPFAKDLRDVLTEFLER